MNNLSMYMLVLAFICVLAGLFILGLIVQRLGSTGTIKVDVRIIAATNRHDERITKLPVVRQRSGAGESIGASRDQLLGPQTSSHG